MENCVQMCVYFGYWTNYKLMLYFTLLENPKHLSESALATSSICSIYILILRFLGDVPNIRLLINV